MAALHGPATWRWRIVEIHEDRAREPLDLEALLHILGETRERRLEAPTAADPDWLERRAESREGAAREALYVFLSAKRGERLLPLWQHVLGLEPTLRKDGPISLRLVGGIAPARLDGLRFVELHEREGPLALLFALPQQHRLHERLAQCVAIVRQRDGHA